MTLTEEAILSSMEGHEWLRPLDFGGSGHNNYRLYAQRMITKGWVEGKAHPEDGRGVTRRTWRYKITKLGVQALHNHRAMRELADRLQQERRP